MDREIPFKCPQTGLAGRGRLTHCEECEDVYRPVECPVCSWFHTIHTKTGAVLGYEQP